MSPHQAQFEAARDASSEMVTREYFDLLAVEAARQGRKHSLAHLPEYAGWLAPHAERQSAPASPFAHLRREAEATSREPPAGDAFSETAAAIIRAGAIRRGEVLITTVPLPPAGVVVTAAGIVAAGKKARGEA